MCRYEVTQALKQAVGRPTGIGGEWLFNMRRLKGNFSFFPRHI